MKVNFLQEVEENRKYHYWYGGDVAEVIVDDNLTIVISAIGDVIGDIYQNGEYLTSFKDKNNRAEFYNVADSYVKDDKVLENALTTDYVDEEHLKENKGLIVALQNNNWWEAFPVINGKFHDIMWALDSYSIDDAIEEVKNNYKEMIV